MKKYTLFIFSIVALLMTTTASYGQGRVSVRQETFALKGQEVFIEMTINMNYADVPANAYVMLTPSLKSGNTAMDLPSVLINGKNQNRKFERLMALHKEPRYIQTVINASDKSAPQHYKYSATVPYEPWMSKAEFVVREDQCQCGTTVQMAYELVAKQIEDRNPPPYTDIQMNLAVSFKIPNPEPVKTRSESGRAYLDFRVGRSEIVPEFGNNAAELEKIGDLIRSVKGNEYATITGIVIDGYASPEGSSNANLSLSTARANSLKNYIKGNYKFSENLFKVNGKGEDWKGLESIVEKSYLDNKDQVLAIVQSGQLNDAKERDLKALGGGSTFKYLLENEFSKLRRSDYQLFYTIVPFAVEKGREVIKTAPANLSLNEMFLVAESYHKNSHEYNEVFEIAARVYPDNDVSNLNAAANALAQGNVSAAEGYLAKVRNHDTAYNNNMGVLYALKRDYAKAAGYFEQSKTENNPEAANNASEVAKINQ